ncbi:MAG: hypothetical protein QXN59_02110 [Candidatus Micrarchaeaceae archaeon]
MIRIEQDLEFKVRDTLLNVDFSYVSIAPSNVQDSELLNSIYKKLERKPQYNKYIKIVGDGDNLLVEIKSTVFTRVFGISSKIDKYINEAGNEPIEPAAAINNQAYEK